MSMEVSFWQVFAAILLIFVTIFLRWFMQPYQIYKHSHSDRNYHLIDNGSTIIGRGIGLPNLLRKEKSNNGSQSSSQKSSWKRQEDIIINTDQICDLTLVVPCYNEQERVPTMMKDHLDYIKRSQKKGSLPKKIEFILVDDGSRDATCNFIKDMTREYPSDPKTQNQTGPSIVVRGITQSNLGKGGAVKRGIMHSSGRQILFLDADGATYFEEIEKFYQQAQQIIKLNKEGGVCLIGNRNQSTDVDEVKRHFHRKFLNFCMNSLTKFVLGYNVMDTQCGFKLFSREAARHLFPAQHLERWAFDVELLYLVKQHNVQLKEIPVRWQDVEGSHLNVLEASCTMARDMLLIKVLYYFGVWNYLDYTW